MKRLFLSLLLCVTIFVKSVSAIGESTLLFWFSDWNMIAYWDSTIYIYCTIIQDFDFNGIYSYARQKWSNAGKPTTPATSYSTANIRVYAGTETQLEIFTGIDIAPNENGLTVGSSTHMYYATYGTESKSVRKQNSQQKVLVVDRGHTENQYKKTTMHELGHALGWLGHSSNLSDIMWSGGSSITSLGNRDVRHINQLY